MPRTSRALLPALITVTFSFAAFPAALSQSQLPAPRSRVVQNVDEARLTILSGNTHPFARAEFDQGALADATPLRRMVLVLQRSSEQEAALQQMIDQQQDKNSAIYHHWLTPEIFGAVFGPTDSDLSAVTTWLGSRGFAGVQVNAARTLIEFSGTAGMVHAAFRTTMHRYAVQGEEHISNFSDPAVPVALAPVIAGFASLNDFPRKAANHKAGNFRHDTINNRTALISDRSTSATQPTFTINDGNTSYGVTPYDFATIYNVLPLWSAATPIDGTGQTIAIVGQTDINPADFVNFRKLFSLPLGNTATPTGTQYLNIIYNGPNPGVTSDEGEADIDTQWSGAVAKGATIDYVVSEGTEVTQGTDLSAIYIVDNNLAPVMSYSYGQCEPFLGASGNAFYKALWQQAAAQGITVFVSTGDSGSAGCDNPGVQGASDGVAVNGLGSTPYNVAVGGTDFYMPNGGSGFWNPTNSTTTQASAKGYIPEVPWNESCTNSVFNSLGSFAGQTPEQVCNSNNATGEGLLSVVGGGGGPSACVQSNGSTASCGGGYAKPSWQTGAGVPGDGVRDLPDVSLFASAGFFGAFYVVCQQSTNSDGQPCSLSGPAYDFAGYGGTSVSSPAFAGILALVNQKTGDRQGNANYVLYNLASQQSKAGIACNAISGAPAASCVFNDVSTDTIAMPCLKGSPNCTVATSTDRYGVLAGYSSTAGYDLASGLGSVNAANLVNNWSSANFIGSSTTLTLSPSTITHGSQVSANVKVTATGGTPTGNVSINALAANGSVQTGTLQNGNYTGSLGSFPGGSYSVQAHYAGDGTYAASDSNPVSLTVNPESSTIAVQSLLYNPSSGVTAPLNNGASLPYGGIILIRADVDGVSGQGGATGNVTLMDSGLPLDGGTFRLNSTSNTEDQTSGLGPGAHIITGAYSGDASFNPSTSSPLTINITKAQTASSIQATPPILSAASIITFTAKIDAHGFGTNGQQGFGAAAPSGLVTFNSGGLSFGSTVLSPYVYPAVYADSSVAVFTVPASQLAIGSNAITASYAGDANYAPSVSAPITVTVTGSTQVASTTVLSLSASSVASGSPYFFTASVSPGSGQTKSPLPTGVVTFTVDGQSIGAKGTLFSGAASIFSGSFSIAPGPHLIAAIYSGDSNYQASASAPASFTIGTAVVPSTATIVVTPATAVQGTEITVTAAITPASPVPTGTVQMMLDGSLYGQPSVLTGATISMALLTNTLQLGQHVVRVLYSGDSNHQSSSSAGATLSILGSVGSFTLSPATLSTTAARGSTSNPVTLTATPTAGFSSTITFSCTGGLPSGAVCLFAPSSVTPTGIAPGTTVLSISPAATALTAAQSAGGARSRSFSPGVVITLSGLLFCFLPRRSRRWNVLVLLLTVFVLGTFSGCGTGGVDPNGTNSGTLSTGSYSVTVTAIGGSTIQTAIVNLTIQ